MRNAMTLRTLPSPGVGCGSPHRLVVPLLPCLALLLTAHLGRAAETVYTYDAANRLTQVHYGDEAVIVYAYDAAGNRTRLTILGPDDPNADHDGNGLPDLWEFRHFGTTGVSADGDPDEDGLDNARELTFGSSPVLRNTDGDAEDDYAEWVAGTNPADPESIFRVTAISTVPSFRVTIRSAPGRVYTLQSIPDLADHEWANVPGQTRVPGDGTELRLGDPNPSPPRFYRVIVEVP